MPVNPTKWPYVSEEVQQRFHVTADCSCDGTKVIQFSEPQWQLLPVSELYAPVWEPIGSKIIKKHNQDSCYQGEDFGGHNIPSPHPAPPKPDQYYDDAFFNVYEIPIFRDARVAAEAAAERKAAPAPALKKAAPAPSAKKAEPAPAAKKAEPEQKAKPSPKKTARDTKE